MTKFLILTGLIVIFLVVLSSRLASHRNAKKLIDLREHIKYSAETKENYDAIAKEFDNLSFVNKRTKSLWLTFQIKFAEYSLYKL